MEEKKKIKISLGTIIYVTIIVVLVIALGIVYYLGFVKNNTNTKLEADNKELNKQITSLKLEKIKLNNKISELEENNEGENANYDKFTTYNIGHSMNGNIKQIDDETNVFTLENPKISFEYPSSWAVSSYIREEDWKITIESPLAGVDMNIHPYKKESEEDDILELDVGSNVVEEGKTKISNYNGYYKKFIFGDSTYYTEAEGVSIDMGNNLYYEIFFGVSCDEDHSYSEKEFTKIQKEYEPIFEKIISSMKF